MRAIVNYITHIDSSVRTSGLNIIGRRRLWYAISAAILVPGVIALAVFGLRLGVDFTGGTLVTVTTNLDREEVVAIVAAEGVNDPQITEAGTDGYQIRFADEVAVEAALNATEGISVLSLEQVGPSVSRDLVQNAFLSLIAVSLAITIYVAFAFRKVEHPGRYGAMAIVALLHDALFVLTLFAVLGRFFGMEVDAFIVTAILTVIGFSVHDTIVVFDRLRENLLRKQGDYASIVNTSINEVMGRSLNTSITTLVVLIALFLLGGAATTTFILALLLGMLAGTYSSIFIAAPLLVSWQRFQAKRQTSKP